MNRTPPAPVHGDGPPRNVLPASVGAHVRLVDVSTFVAGVGGVQVYPTGVAFALTIRSIRPGLRLNFGGPPKPASEPCHLSVRYPDGETVTGDYLTLGDTPEG
jgi:hypothetical protein